jgi:hypothetical protein
MGNAFAGQGFNSIRLPANQGGGTLMMGGFTLGDDGATDGMLLNQFLSQALGGLVGGVGAPAPTPEELVESDRRRMSDMTAFADFVESYLGTVPEAAGSYRMRADSQDSMLAAQRIWSRAEQGGPQAPQAARLQTQAQVLADQGTATQGQTAQTIPAGAGSGTSELLVAPSSAQGIGMLVSFPCFVLQFHHSFLLRLQLTENTPPILIPPSRA